MSNLHQLVADGAAYPPFLRDGRGKCGDDAKPDDFTEDGNRKNQRRRRERARRVCYGCPFQSPCYAWAVETGQQGVYGASTTEERRRAGSTRNE